MNTIKSTIFTLALTSLLSIPSLAPADSIAPDTFSRTLTVGESYTLHKTVTVSANPAALVDVLFLFDTTSSMSGLIDSAKSNAASITSALSSFGSVSYGVSDYRDFPAVPFGVSGTDYAYQNVLNVGSNAAAAQAAINSLTIGGGYDSPESNLYALQQAATSSWRTSSEFNRFIVWFGDASGHTSLDTGYPAGISVANTVAALNSNNVKVEAINLSKNPFGGINTNGQANAVATGTAGGLYNLSNVSNITATIQSAITASFNKYSKVNLDVSETHSGVGVSVTPVLYSGAWDRSADHTFEYDVTFTGLAVGSYDFDINALVDYGITATEHDFISVYDKNFPTEPVPEPATFVLFAAGLAGLAIYRRSIAE